MPTMKIMTYDILPRISLVHEFSNLWFNAEFTTSPETMPPVNQLSLPDNDIFPLAMFSDVLFESEEFRFSHRRKEFSRRMDLEFGIALQHLNQHVTVTRRRTAPAKQNLASEFFQRVHKLWLVFNPLTVGFDNLITSAIVTDFERIRPLRLRDFVVFVFASDVNVIGIVLVDIDCLDVYDSGSH
jgi:hypothetical protein